MTVYALKHPDGRSLYHLPKPAAFGTPGFGGTAKVTGVFADGQPMTALSGDWWATDTEASRLTMTALPDPVTTGYRLSDPDAESLRYPATLTREQFSERVGNDEDSLWTLYDRVTEDLPAVEHVYDGPVMVLEGREPPAPDEPQWVAQLPQLLTQRPEYLHLFPGHIPGLVNHLMDVFKTLPRVEHVFLNFQNRPGVYVSLRIPFDPPQTVWRADTSRRTGKTLKTGRNVPEVVSRSITLPIPDRVCADNYEQALALWQQQVDYWVAQVEAATVAACPSCNGTGHVAHGAEKYSTRQ